MSKKTAKGIQQIYQPNNQKLQGFMQVSNDVELSNASEEFIKKVWLSLDSSEVTEISAKFLKVIAEVLPS